jgi:hypothetical protein
VRFICRVQSDVSGNPAVDAALLAEANEMIAQNDASQGAAAAGDGADDEEPL